MQELDEQRELILRRLLLLAEDVGRLRRLVEAGSYSEVLVTRISEQIKALDAIVHPTAAELALELDVQTALVVVDARVSALQNRLSRDGFSRSLRN